MVKILIVEDSRSYNNTLTSLLSKFNYEVSQCFSLEEAKKAINNNNYDYIILDLILPDGNGDTLIETINKQNPNTKIIILTGHHDIQKRSHLFSNGILDYYSKDIPIKLLIKDLHKLINSLEKNQDKNILIVDDSEFVLETVRQILEIKNYNVYTAVNPIEAFKLFEKKELKIDLIFLDIEMPKMSGIEFLEKIKRNIVFKNVPIIMISSTNDREKYTRVLKHGAIDFIRKPFLIEEILLKTDIHITQAGYLRQIAENAKELEEYKRILNESDMVSKTNPSGIIKEANDKFCEISGYSREFLMGKSHKVIRHPDMPKKVFKELWTKVKEHKTFKGIIKNKRKDGTSYYVDATISPVIDIDGNIKEIIGIRHDITEIMNPKKQLLADISYLDNPVLIFLQIANYDLFKEFYSETLMHTFEFELEQVILNYFPQGMELKKVYNLSNGLFGFLKNKETTEKDLTKRLKEVIKRFKQIGISFKETNYDIDICISFAMKGEHILDDVSLGIQHGLKYKTPIVHAQDFHKQAQIQAKQKLQNIGLIKDALHGKGKFVSYFQGIVDNQTQEIKKYESLIRLIDIEGNVISPFQFLDISKKTGYYSDITELVIENSFTALKHTDKDITINLSSSDIEDSFIRKKLYSLITKKENIGRITFELLEDEEVQDFSLVKDFILKAKKEGKVQIAIDDFGSGYSNYKRLLEFQPDILKIDASLIKEIESDEYSRNIVQSIILFAKSQNIKTVAEFVKDEITFKIVKDLGIDYSQGFYFDKPKELF